MGASPEAAGGAVSCRCHSPPPPRMLSDGSARHLLRQLLGSTQLPVRAPPSCLGGGINCCQPPFHTPDNKREPPGQCLRKINKLPEPLQLNTLAYFTEMFPVKKAGPPQAGGGGGGHRTVLLSAGIRKSPPPHLFALSLGKPRSSILIQTNV